MNSQASPIEQHWLPNEDVLVGLYRFAILLHGNPTSAMEAISSGIKKLSKHPEIHEPERGERFLFASVMRSAPQKLMENPASEEKLTIPHFLANLPKIPRAALALFYATKLPPYVIARILGIPLKDLCRCVNEHRQPEGKATPPHQEKGKNVGMVLERPPEEEMPAGAGSGQQSLDKERIKEVEKIHPGPDVLAALLEKARSADAVARSKPFSFADPGILAAGFALFLVLIFGIWTLLAKADAFAGEPELRSLLETATSAGPEDFEPVDAFLGELGDWFLLKGIESTFVPPGFAEQRAVGARVFSFEGTRVAAAALPESTMMAFLFDGSPLGIAVEPPGTWRVFTVGENAVAVTQRGGMCFVATIRGDEETLLKKLTRIQSVK